MKMIISGLIATTSFLTFASTKGLPNQDPVVKNIRERFNTGIEPKVEQITKIKWACKEFIAGKNDFRVLNVYEMEFISFDGLITLKSSSEGFDGKVLTFNGQELTGTFGSQYSSDVDDTSWRLDIKGNLINEYSYAPAHPSMELAPYGRSSYSNTKVASYTLCVKP